MNLLYNGVATPGALYRYWRQGRGRGTLTLVLIAGTLPGVIAGSVIRVELLPGARLFDFVVAAVLLPLGGWLALTAPASAGGEARPAPAVPAARDDSSRRGGGLRRRDLRQRRRLDPGSILVGTGRTAKDAAPAPLASTCVTSVAGMATFTILPGRHHGTVAPDSGGAGLVPRGRSGTLVPSLQHPRASRSRRAFPARREVAGASEGLCRKTSRYVRRSRSRGRRRS